MVKKIKVKSYANFRKQVGKFYNSARKNVSLRAGYKALLNFEKKWDKATKSKNLNYAKLEVFSLSQLKKMGFTDKAIYNKLNAYYRKEGRQLTLDITDTKKFSKTIIDVHKGRVREGKKIPITFRTKEKDNYNNLKKFARQLGTNSTANKILQQYNRGEISWWGLNSVMHSYANNITMYEDESTLNNAEIDYLIKDYNDGDI